MDSREFDALLTALARTESRRRAAWLVGSVVASALIPTGGQEPAAAKRRRHHPTCHDRKRNGAETDVDCGGTCPRCAIGKCCLLDNDCDSGVCVSGRCAQCTPAYPCGSDASGFCQCHESFTSGEPVCDAATPLGLTVDDCAKCPAGTETCVTINGLLFNCHKRCGSGG
jgi:hypothetical protein